MRWRTDCDWIVIYLYIEEDMGKKRSQKSLETSVTVQKFPASNIYCYGKDRDSR